jgi:spore germination protein GerM
MRSRIRRLVATTALVSACLAGATCGFPADNTAEPIAAERLPDGLRTDQTAAPSTVAGQERATIWLIDDDHLTAVRHLVNRPVTVASIVKDLLAGPSAIEQASGLRSALPDASLVSDVELVRGAATVSVSPEFAHIPPADQLFAVGQLVLTLTDARGVGGVKFVRDDAPIAVPLPTGETSEGPVYREQFIAMSRAPEDRS